MSSYHLCCYLEELWNTALTICLNSFSVVVTSSEICFGFFDEIWASVGCALFFSHSAIVDISANVNYPVPLFISNKPLLPLLKICKTLIHALSRTVSLLCVQLAFLSSLNNKNIINPIINSYISQQQWNCLLQSADFMVLYWDRTAAKTLCESCQWRLSESQHRQSLLCRSSVICRTTQNSGLFHTRWERICSKAGSRLRVLEL